MHCPFLLCAPCALPSGRAARGVPPCPAPHIWPPSLYLLFKPTHPFTCGAGEGACLRLHIHMHTHSRTHDPPPALPPTPTPPPPHHPQFSYPVGRDPGVPRTEGGTALYAAYYRVGPGRGVCAARCHDSRLASMHRWSWPSWGYIGRWHQHWACCWCPAARGILLICALLGMQHLTDFVSFCASLPHALPTNSLPLPPPLLSFWVSPTGLFTDSFNHLQFCSLRLGNER